MENPVSLGGEYTLTEVRGRRLPLAEARVRDCPACEGYLHEDRRHVAATVSDGRRSATHYLCGPDCFTGWLRLLREDRRVLYWEAPN